MSNTSIDARRERRRKRKRQVLIYKMLILLALVAALVVCLVMAVRSIHPKTPKTPDASAEASSASGSSGSEEGSEGSGGESESVPADISGSDKYRTDDRAGALALAEDLASHYDYDTALAVLAGYSGYANDNEFRTRINQYTSAKADCVPVDVEMVPHVFYHSLMNDSRGLRESYVGEYVAMGNNCWMCTVPEFNTMTQQMYDYGCVLIRLRDLVKETRDADGTVHFVPNDSLMLPRGKTAVIMSEDDLSYYHSYDNQGFASRLVVDQATGKVKALYQDEFGGSYVGDYDVVPLLSTFIDKHPDFSYKNAHLIVAMTGYNGCFGYRTDASYVTGELLDDEQKAWLEDNPSFNHDNEVMQARAVAEAMKAEGFEFASHTWGHLRAGDVDLDRLIADNERFVASVVPVIGEVDTIIFAHGQDIGDWHDYSMDNEKFAYYKGQGYNFYCNVDGSTPYWIQLRDNYVRTGRIDLDGYRLYKAMMGEENSVRCVEAVGIHDINMFFSMDRMQPVELTG